MQEQTIYNIQVRDGDLDPNKNPQDENVHCSALRMCSVCCFFCLAPFCFFSSCNKIMSLSFIHSCSLCSQWHRSQICSRSLLGTKIFLFFRSLWHNKQQDNAISEALLITDKKEHKRGLCGFYKSVTKTCELNKKWDAQKSSSLVY